MTADAPSGEVTVYFTEGPQNIDVNTASVALKEFFKKVINALGAVPLQFVRGSPQVRDQFSAR